MFFTGGDKVFMALKSGPRLLIALIFLIETGVPSLMCADLHAPSWEHGPTATAQHAKAQISCPHADAAGCFLHCQAMLATLCLSLTASHHQNAPSPNSTNITWLNVPEPRPLRPPIYSSCFT
jgi:hypothetical protein